ncbi:PREDICTED: uncharacterized protein LOC109593203 [Amphimedon queenslandica]|uniref:DUF4203 domain-containing protein n=1 Tax=Amphimedon queenslandica TaxID=400682 RepID=A0AAN0K442_AMPQE|nr:PREDICTED: uncharacterized protein LOC109593203 [Amphimedon queenslandica]|eukprot:XP_019863951.1 PREDICTED: uncharacterized protein LOC109593203 [Amphimedon queenslandica]
MYIKFTGMKYLDHVCTSVGITGVFLIILFAYSFYFTQFMPIFLGATIGAAGTVLILSGDDLSCTCFAFVIGVMIGVVTGAIFEPIGNIMFIFIIILPAVTIMCGLLLYLYKFKRVKRLKLVFDLPIRFPKEVELDHLTEAELHLPTKTELHLPTKTKL